MPLQAAGVRRLQKDLKEVTSDPPPFICAKPDGDDLANWYYLIEGPPDSLYAGGMYLGRVTFPDNYPFAPPGIFMITPNGRFQVDTRLCLSISDYHPETWSPMWGAGTILTGVLSFMLETAGTVGSINTTDAQKKKFAKDSHAFNLSNKIFLRLFEEKHAKAEELAGSSASAKVLKAKAPKAKAAKGGRKRGRPDSDED